ncbi:MAG: hypothetical protein ACKOFI_03125, partial [Phycisphaerales bacterium]
MPPRPPPWFVALVPVRWAASCALAARRARGAPNDRPLLVVAEHAGARHVADACAQAAARGVHARRPAQAPRGQPAERGAVAPGVVRHLNRRTAPRLRMRKRHAGVHAPRRGLRAGSGRRGRRRRGLAAMQRRL